MFNYIKDKWYTLSIKNKQLTFFGIIILLVSLISFYSQQNNYSFMNKYNDNYNKYYRINKLHIEVSKNRELIERYLKDINNENLQEYNKSVETIESLLLEVDRDSDTLNTYLQTKAIKSSLEAYFDECRYAIKVRNYENSNYYMSLFNALHINDYIKGYIQQLLNITLREGSWFHKYQLIPKANNIKVITFVTITFISVLCLYFALLFSNYLTRPIRKLAAASIKMSKGDLEVREVRLKSNDEVGILADSFMKMNVSIKELVNDLTEKSIIERKLHEEELKNAQIGQLLKEAEFLGLQSQINPHFLFNTLNTIARTSMFEKADNTTKLIQSLSAIFRYNLESKSTIISLAKEIEITRKYIYIQQFRFRDRLKFDIKCHVDLESISIPRFTLQPLVENAIIHGIEPKENGGCLRIKVQKKDDYIIIKVIDNGVGIPKDKIEKIMNFDEDPYQGHTTGIGVSNVLRRLNFHFNNRDCFNINSKVDLGTVITISFPSLDKGSELIV